MMAARRVRVLTLACVAWTLASAGCDATGAGGGTATRKGSDSDGGRAGAERVGEHGSRPGAHSGDVESERALEDRESSAKWRLGQVAFCQQHFISRRDGASPCVDGDGNGRAEYGTLSELLGMAPLRIAGRRDESRSRQGTVFPEAGGVRVKKHHPGLDDLDKALGVLVQNGYVIQVFLPDTSTPSKWVSEEWGSDGKTLRIGGSGEIDSALAEEYWCAYAIPLEWGRTGRAVYFMASGSTVLRSRNERGRMQGTKKIDPTSAFLGIGATSQMAVGTRGRDGELWEETK